jgi:hypothetical protein
LTIKCSELLWTGEVINHTSSNFLHFCFTRRNIGYGLFVLTGQSIGQCFTNSLYVLITSTRQSEVDLCISTEHSVKCLCTSSWKCLDKT